MRMGAICYDDVDVTGNEVRGQYWQPIVPSLAPPIFDSDVFPLDVSSFAQSATKGGDLECKRIGRPKVKVPDCRHPSCCVRGERPRDRGAAEQRDELAPPHSITSSAWASSVSGT